MGDGAIALDKGNKMRYNKLQIKCGIAFYFAIYHV